MAAEQQVSGLSSGRSVFSTTMDGQVYTWSMGVLDTIRRYEDMIDQAKVDGKSRYTVLDEIAALVIEASGPPLNTDQADEFVDLLYQQLAVKKKGREADTDSMLRCLSSTGSTRTPGATKSSSASGSTSPG